MHCTHVHVTASDVVTVLCSMALFPLKLTFPEEPGHCYWCSTNILGTVGVNEGGDDRHRGGHGNGCSTSLGARSVPLKPKDSGDSGDRERG